MKHVDVRLITFPVSDCGRYATIALSNVTISVPVTAVEAVARVSKNIIVTILKMDKPECNCDQKFIEALGIKGHWGNCKYLLSLTEEELKELHGNENQND